MRIGLITGAGRAETYLARTAEWDGSIEVVPVEVATGGFPRNEIDLRLKELVYIDAGLRAVQQGCDAVVINTVCDYGLAPLRSALPIPVVGAGHAAFHAAMGLGRAFSVVTVWPEQTAWIYRRILADYGVADRCQSLLHVHSQEELVAFGGASVLMDGLERGDGRMHDTIFDSARDSVKSGADVVVLGCCCMGAAAGRLRSLLDVPVIEPFTTACRTAAMLVELGLRQSPATYRPASFADLDQVQRAVNGAHAGAADDVCAFCATLDEPEPVEALD